jgi:uncharacterized membrane protein
VGCSGQASAPNATDCSNFLHAFLWENGHMTDLNLFVPFGSGLILTQATFINDRGEIAAEGMLSNGDLRAVLLIPCDENHLNIEGCDYNWFDVNAAAESIPVRTPVLQLWFPKTPSGFKINEIR